jgi:hypothetical protein
MIALVLLAQLAATPAATPTPAPVVKAESGQTRTLADVARERKLGKKGVVGGTLSVAGAPVSGGSAPVSRSSGAPGAAAQPAGPDEETYWRQRNADARAELAAANEALGRVEASIPSYSFSGRGSGAAAAISNQVREGTLAPYKARVAEAAARVNALPEEARRAGAQPGWVRGDAAPEQRKISLRETERQLNNGDAPLPARDRDDRGTTR